MDKIHSCSTKEVSKITAVQQSSRELAVSKFYIYEDFVDHNEKTKNIYTFTKEAALY